MSAEATSETMRSYLEALLSRGDFAEYFTDDVTWTIIGTDQTMQGREPVRDFLTWMHTQAFDAHPKVKTLIVDDGQAVLEADFVGTHTGEFLGMPATGKSVSPGALLCGLRPAGRQDRRPSRLHPHGPVRPNSSDERAGAGWDGPASGEDKIVTVGEPAIDTASPTPVSLHLRHAS